MSINLSPSAAKRRGFLTARIAADQAEVELIDKKGAEQTERLKKAADEAAGKLAARQARLDARLGNAVESADAEKA